MTKTLAKLASVALLAAVSATGAFAQSSGASPADPNNERNQNMGMSNSQPSDPAANDTPSARVPTDPVERDAARREDGGPTGTGSASGEAGSDVIIVPDNDPND